MLLNQVINTHTCLLLSLLFYYLQMRAIKSFDATFQNAFTRFAEGWRGDVAEEDRKVIELAPGADSTFLAADTEVLWKNVEYCSFLLNSEVTP